MIQLREMTENVAVRVSFQKRSLFYVCSRSAGVSPGPWKRVDLNTKLPAPRCRRDLGGIVTFLLLWGNT